MFQIRAPRFRNVRSHLSGQAFIAAMFVVGFGLAGILTLVLSHAATPTASFEVEGGIHSSCAQSVSDQSASSQNAIRFGGCTGSTPGNPSADAGASLPIEYSLASLRGNLNYVAPTGSDSTGDGSLAKPYATLTQAVSSTPANGAVVIRGGTYRGQGGVNVTKPMTITAYPGEVPVFNGAAAVSSGSGWTTSGSLKYRAYTPIPVSDGSGISFTTCMNQSANCLGKYPDQVWVGGSQLRQVATQAVVTAGTFYVDTDNGRVYMDNDDIAAGNVEVSDERTFLKVSAPNVVLRGMKVVRYSNTPSDAGVITFSGTADNGLVENLYESDTSFIAMAFTTSAGDLNVGSTVRDSTVRYGNWMGITANATTNFTLDHSDVGYMNQFVEFTASPQSGSLKTSRTWYTKVLNSKITNNIATKGLWFDQSNYKTVVAGNYIANIDDSALFFEISDYLYAVNNYIASSGNGQAVKTAGSSNLYFLNNTLVGGNYPFGIYVDNRSVVGCSDPAQPICPNSPNSDRDSYRPHLATMTWMPSLNLFANNILAYPTGTRCGSLTTFCITKTNGNADVPLQDILHKADNANGIPQTLIDSNVYANGTGNIFTTSQLGSYTTTGALAAGMATAPVGIGGFEARGLYGNSYVAPDGSPTAALNGKHSGALQVPTDSAYNAYLPAGIKHYGVTWK